VRKTQGDEEGDRLTTHLEGLEAGDALLLLQAGVDHDRREVALLQDAVELHGTVDLKHVKSAIPERKDG